MEYLTLINKIRYEKPNSKDIYNERYNLGYGYDLTFYNSEMYLTMWFHATEVPNHNRTVNTGPSVYAPFIQFTPINKSLCINSDVNELEKLIPPYDIARFESWLEYLILKHYN